MQAKEVSGVIFKRSPLLLKSLVCHFYVDVFHVSGILLAIKMVWTRIISDAGKYQQSANTTTDDLLHMRFAFGLSGESWTYHGCIINSISLSKILYVFIHFLYFDLIRWPSFLYLIYSCVNDFVLDIRPVLSLCPPAIHKVCSNFSLLDAIKAKNVTSPDTEADPLPNVGRVAFSKKYQTARNPRCKVFLYFELPFLLLMSQSLYDFRRC